MFTVDVKQQYNNNNIPTNSAADWGTGEDWGSGGGVVVRWWCMCVGWGGGMKSFQN